MSLFALILSACVGAVNLPAGTIAETKTEKTESETKTPKKLVIEEPEPQDKKVVETVEPKPIISVEPKPISANPCIANPFGNACSVEFDFIRELACRHESDSERCAPTIARICNMDSLDPFCIGDKTYYPAQKIACASEPDSERCASTITRVCDADSLDVLCDGKATYYHVQKRTCTNDKSDSRCGSTIARVCGADSLDALCKGLTAYFPAQKTACAGGNSNSRCHVIAERVCGTDVFHPYCNVYGGDNPYLYSERKIACASEPDSTRCQWTIVLFCDDEPLNALCNGKAHVLRAQKTACGGARPWFLSQEEQTERCAPIISGLISGVCGRDPLDSLCDDRANYYPARETACASEPNSRRCLQIFSEQKIACLYGYIPSGTGNLHSNQCVQTVARVCDANAFDTLCNEFSNYKTARETTCTSEPNSERCIPTIDRVCGVDAFGVLCQLSNLTMRHFPAKPNTNFTSNTGNSPGGSCGYATCYGSIPDIINIKRLNNTNTGMATYTGEIVIKTASRIVGCKFGCNIDIIVNFDDNALMYSGNFSSTSSTTDTFNMDGNFTEKGLLTGTVNFRGIEAPLIGLVGQTEAMGVFATSVEVFSSFDVFGGGFRVFRKSE